MRNMKANFRVGDGVGSTREASGNNKSSSSGGGVGGGGGGGEGIWKRVILRWVLGM